MRTFHTLSLGTALILALGTASLPAQAQDSYRPNRKEAQPTREQMELLGYSGILPQSYFRFTFLNRRGGNPDDLHMQIIMPTPVQGCAKIIPYEATSAIQGKALVVDVELPIVMANHSAENRYNCAKSSVVGTEIKFSHSELLSRGVNELRMRTKFGVAPYTMDVTQHSISIKSKNQALMKSLDHWILPENTVIVTVPMAKGDMYHQRDQLDRLARIARARGLSPIETQLPDFIPPTKQINRYYFLDVDGRVSAALEDASGSISIGKLYTTQEYFGPNGKYDKEIELDVVAQIPLEHD